jgi:Ala-tRNA(Pro) deacylase
MASPHDLLKYFDDNEIYYSILIHPPVFTSADQARMAHLPERYIVRTELMNIGGQFWMVVFPADRTIRKDLLSMLFDGKGVRDATEEELLFYFPSCHTMTVPPFGNLYGLQVIVEASLMHGMRIVFSACSHTKSILMRWIDYEQLVRPVVKEFCVPRVVTKVEASTYAELQAR